MSTASAFLSDVPSYVDELTRSTTWSVPLPPDFRDEIVVANGITMALTVGIHQDRRDRSAVILIPGLFNSRVQHVMRKVARAAFFEGGFDVIIPDLRGFGKTGRINRAPPSGGWEEAQDIVAVADWVREQFAPTALFVAGFSYGASIAITAAARAPGSVFDGCVAFCPFGDARFMIERLSSATGVLDPFAGFQLFFEYLLRSLCRLRSDGSCGSYAEHFERHISVYYGVSADELYRRSSPIEALPHVSCPTVVVYALDDPVIPIQDAIAFVRRARSNASIRVQFLRRGGHYGQAMSRRVVEFLQSVSLRDV